jgi:chemotaxis protein CheX
MGQKRKHTSVRKRAQKQISDPAHEHTPQEAMPSTVQLPSNLDLTAAQGLAGAFLAKRGCALLVEAHAVQRVSTQCIQVLLSAASTWRVDGVPLRILKPSPELVEAIGLIGIKPSDLMIEEVSQ